MIFSERSNDNKVLVTFMDDNGFRVSIMDTHQFKSQSISFDLWQLQDLRDELNRVIDYMTQPIETNYDELERG